MSSKLYHGEGSHGDDVSKPVHFFKIMLSDTILDKKLRIPGKFVRKYGERLSNKIVLKLPNDAEWEVNLKKGDGGIWLQNGWKEFVEHHSLRHGHLLVFKYEGTSCFHVLICDMSAMEIDYPFYNVHDKRAKTSEELRPLKTRKTNANNKEMSTSNLKDSSFPQIISDCKGKLNNPSEEKRTIDLHLERPLFGNSGALKAVANTSFTRIIKSCKMKWKCMWLPKGSLKGYIKPGKQYATLLVGERQWRISLIHYEKRSMTCLSAGWSVFAKENNLDVGDACSFELLSSIDNIMMKVFIYKNSSVKS